MAHITTDEFARGVAAQYHNTLNRLGLDLTGSDELSALIKCVIKSVLFKEIQTTPSLAKWVIFTCLDPNTFGLREGDSLLTPYTTSMDATIPGEDIVMLVKQHRVPGTEIDRWTAKQDGAKIAYLANDRILACRLNGLWAYLGDKRARGFGSLKGQVSIGPEFFELMPDEELAAWYGATENC